MVDRLAELAPLLNAGVGAALVVLVLIAIRRAGETTTVMRRIERLETHLADDLPSLHNQGIRLLDLLAEIHALLSDVECQGRRRLASPQRGVERTGELYRSDTLGAGPERFVQNDDRISSPEATPDGNVGVTAPRAPEFTREAVLKTYQHWKTEGRDKPDIEGWDIRWMRGAGKTAGNELTPGRPLLQDSEGKGDFVRFSRSGSGEGIVFPNPFRDMEPAVHGSVFTEADPAGGVSVTKRQDGRWETP